MRLYLMRHGHAVKERATLDNFHRPLTDTGIAETEKMGRHLKEMLPDQAVGIYLSPLVRTQQTGEILARTLRDGRAAADVTSGTLYALARDNWEPLDNHLINLTASGGPEDVFFVSHQPFLEAWLYGLSGISLSFKQSSIAVVDLRRGKKSKLVAYLTPSLWEK